jgi:hypothetical protein
VVNKTNRRC